MSIHWNWSDLLEATKGQVLSKGDEQFLGIGTDTRFDLNQKVFIPLKGQNFDAHNFLLQAVQKGAKAFVLEKWPENLSSSIGIIKVEDTLKALQNLASYWRTKNKFKVLAVTGSQGKTTTKEFARCIISQRRKISCSEKNFNNHLGVPLSILEADSENQLMLLEMGMNHKGEIRKLCQIAQPDVVLVTVVGSAHRAHFHSIEDLAKAKSEIYSESPHAVQIFNYDQDWTKKMYEDAKNQKRKVVTFSSQDPSCDVFLRIKNFSKSHLEIAGSLKGCFDQVEVPVFGTHNLINLMSASALSLEAGLSPEEVWSGLSFCRSPWGRCQWISLKSKAQLLFDAYNSNPESVKSLLENVFQLNWENKKYLVLGEMLELGDQASFFHKELGKRVAYGLWDSVFFFGPSFKDFEEGYRENSQNQKNLFLSVSYEEKLAYQLLSMIKQNDLVVVKGSRGMALEQILDILEPINF